jgi:hypothetical protein
MKDRALMAVAGVAFVSLVVAASATDVKQPLPAEAGDLATATRVEIKDASGQAVLAADFGAAVESGGERERKALLTGAGSARGEAEVELVTAADGTAHQDLEVDVEGVAPNAALTVFVDGKALGSFTADAKGEAEIELTGRAGR